LALPSTSPLNRAIDKEFENMKTSVLFGATFLASALAFVGTSDAQSRPRTAAPRPVVTTPTLLPQVIRSSPRARDLGVPFEGTPGRFNAITDVVGIEVGQTTVLDGRARTGVTAIFPRGKTAIDGVFAAQIDFNGTGEMTGSHLIQEIGGFFGPILLTGTVNVGAVSAATQAWTKTHIANEDLRFTRVLPVVAETYDGLSDVWSFPIKPEHVWNALDTAKGGPVLEGAVGGGTGMTVHDFKGGNGTSSRIVDLMGKAYTVGVFVQANYGYRESLTIAGVPVGKEITDLMPIERPPENRVEGSIIIIVATDAPLSATQLQRLARRATVGLSRIGGGTGTNSGDIYLAFSTANSLPIGTGQMLTSQSVPAEEMAPLFRATAWATEEAIVNAMVAARDMTSADGRTVFALPHDRLRAALAKYNRLLPMPPQTPAAR
jgi:D-aminopeptidase